jgi:hypothetical protein
MNLPFKCIFLIAGIVLFCSCTVIEKASKHEFESDYYKLRSGQNKVEKVYLDITSEKIEVYPIAENQVSKKLLMNISLLRTDSLYRYPIIFGKKSLDIDITTILFKYHPTVFGLPAQLTTDFNGNLYAGWRRDNYRVQGKPDPLGKCHYEIINRGYDFGFFAGPGTTLIGPFSTRNKFSNEYYGMVIQFGFAGFIESNVASFGIATGFDYLLSHDRNIWIYNKKPWIGFIIGIALN